MVSATVVIDLVLYRRSQPDLGSGAVDQPTWALVAALLAVSLVGVAVLAWRPARTSRLVVPFVIVMAVVTSLAVLPAIALVEAVPLPEYMQHVPRVAATRQAWQAVGVATTGGNCTTIRHDPTGLLPTPYLRCAYLDSAYGPQVYYTFQATGGSQYGFIFTPRKPAGGGSCARHIAGHWWAEVTTHTIRLGWVQLNQGDAVVCPSSYKFMPV
jgi:hypothetical protein